MPNFAELQVAFINAQSRERTYWSNLVRTLERLGEDFVRYLELPSPTFVIGEKERNYVSITQINDTGVIKAFDHSDYEKRARSIPFTITVAIPDAPRQIVREVSIDMTLSANDGQPGVYSAEFDGGGRWTPYRPGSSRALMDEIANVLKDKAESV
ncbi:hypothetical protein AL527_09765 [Pseudomonas fulva]|uniref:hypothetical protein n=1 Tax=Pseudomonas fulva TaxID=47880 RepID=UPI000CE99A11|nr:hypothetical protein [Pseudomonas fulva]AVF55426.1 hypothetical protein AL527_09765 [Pseudomonas fulva]